MAKYSDYVKNDTLENEIADASAQTAARQDDEDATIPERFRGKSVAEVAASYMELQTKYSQQGNDLGQMRRTVDELLALKLPSEVQNGQPSKKSVTVDDIYEKPDDTIRQVVREETTDRLAELERELQKERGERALAKFTETFPTWQQDVASPEMIEWIKAKPYRVRLAMAADKGDLDAAADLFGSYYDTRKPVVKAEKRAETKRKVLEAGLESSGAPVPETVETYSRSALMEKRIAAKRGDSSAERWLNAHAQTIQQAYAEGRVVD